MKSKGKVKLYLPTKKAKSPLKMPLHSCEMSTPETPRASPLVIDLTTDSDGDGVPPNAIQVCKPTVKPLSSPPMNHSDSATLSKPLVRIFCGVGCVHQSHHSPLTIYHSFPATTRYRPSNLSELLQFSYFPLASERRDFPDATSAITSLFASSVAVTIRPTSHRQIACPRNV
ncbi:hypothetical protein BS17DRAFT_8856 [Gyrodon lividus]|nr:hypothetical protein BS17DRAFT_8856 [Gyrodon lividus]